MSKVLAATAKGLVLAFTGVVLGAALNYLASLFIARVAGARQFGLYTLVVAVTSLLASAALSALDRGLIRYVAVYRSAGDRQRERAVVTSALAWVAITSVLGALVLYAQAERLAAVFRGGPALAMLLRLAAWAVPFMNVLSLLTAAADGRRDMRYRLLTADLIRTGSFLLLLWGTWAWTRVTAVRVVEAYLASYVLAAGAAVILARRHLRVFWRPDGRLLREVVGFSIPFVLIQGLNQANAYMGVFLLGIIGTPREVGVFGIATVLAAAIGLMLEAVIRIYSPTVAALLDREERREAEALLRHVNRWSLIWTAPIVVFALLFGGDLLAWLGRDYATAGVALAVLTLGYAVNAVTGPVGVTLTMAGHAWLNLVDQAAALVVRGLLGVWLIPRMGVLGAAVASATAMVLANVLRVWQVRSAVRIWGYDGSIARPVAAALASGGAAWFAVHGLLRLSSLGEIVVGGGILAAAYGASLGLFGLDRRDRDVLRAGVRKVWTPRASP